MYLSHPIVNFLKSIPKIQNYLTIQYGISYHLVWWFTIKSRTWKPSYRLKIINCNGKQGCTHVNQASRFIVQFQRQLFFRTDELKIQHKDEFGGAMMSFRPDMTSSEKTLNLQLSCALIFEESQLFLIIFQHKKLRIRKNPCLEGHIFTKSNLSLQYQES